MKKPFTLLLCCFFISHLAFSVPGPVTTAGSLRICDEDPITVPVTVTNFNNIGTISLQLNYTSAFLQFQSVDVNPAISTADLFTNGTTPGVFILSFTSATGISLSDNDTLFWLTFSFIGPNSGVSTALLSWPQTPPEANEYAAPDGTPYDKAPFENYFIGGIVTIEPLGCGLGGPRTIIGQSFICLDRDFEIPVKVENFLNVGMISLTMNYHPTYFQYQGVDLNPAISSGDIFTNGANAGVFVLSFVSAVPVSLSDDDTLFTLQFHYSGPGTPGSSFPVTWAQTPPEANEYSTVEAVPFTKYPFGSYFYNGSATYDPESCGVWVPLSNWPLVLAIVLMLSFTVYIFRRRMIS